VSKYLYTIYQKVYNFLKSKIIIVNIGVIFLKHLIPPIETLVQRNFHVIDYQDLLKELDTIKTEISLTEISPIFCRKENELLYVTSRQLQEKDFNTSQISFHKSTTITLDELNMDIINLLTEYEYVFVEDQIGNPVGYLTSKYILKEIFQSYEYLKAYFDTMIQTMDASITIIDENENTVVWTKGAEQIFSVTYNDIVGKPIDHFFPREMLETINSLKTGKTTRRMQHQPRPDLFVLINTNPIYLNDKIVGAVASELDITSQVRLNQELFTVSSKVHHLEQEMAKLSPSTDPFQNIKGNSQSVKYILDAIIKIGTTNATVLILGESGVGKELFAKAVHDIRENPNAPFVAINCGAIAPSLFESELFGYEKGAFSGADNKGKKGKIELARGGTLFLDEIGEMPLDMQVKILRVLQEKKYFAVGGTKQLEADVRIVAATNRNLESLIKEGKFREDLYYRLNVISLDIPPLRNRKEEILELTHYFLNEFSVRYNRLIQGISQDVMHALFQYDWPGNIRELRNTIERLVVFATNGEIKSEDLPIPLQQTLNIAPMSVGTETLSSQTLQEELEFYEKQIILKTLNQENGNKQATAKKLGVSRATLYNKMNKLLIPEN
jgi:PAS domain S-box-containing protein